MQLVGKLNPHGNLSWTHHRFIRRTYYYTDHNYFWHVDRYDKLKPFSIAISGCIDGFSCRIFWLKCGPSNSPRVIENNFMDCIRIVEIISLRLHGDCGDHYTGARSHMLGSSTSNQGIEFWWSIFRKQWEVAKLCIFHLLTFL